MMTNAGEFEGVGDDRAEIDFRPIARVRKVAGLAGLQDLLNGSEESLVVLEHDAVKLATLSFFDWAGLQRFEIETDAGDGSFQFVGDGVEEAVLAFVALDFADDEDGVDDEAGDYGGEEDDAEDQRDDGAGVVDDPADVEEDRDGGEDGAEGDEEGDRAGAAGD